jgi:hypothetical protein
MKQKLFEIPKSFKGVIMKVCNENKLKIYLSIINM